jgi:hypothetical protein
MSDFDKVIFPWPQEGAAWDGLPMAKIGLRAEFFFGNGYGPELREPLMATRAASLKGPRLGDSVGCVSYVAGGACHLADVSGGRVRGMGT